MHVRVAGLYASLWGGGWTSYKGKMLQKVSGESHVKDAIAAGVLSVPVCWECDAVYWNNFYLCETNAQHSCMTKYEVNLEGLQRRDGDQP